jgi:hypothetical protein
MDSCEEFYNKYKKQFEDCLRCEVSYGRGFLIFYKKNTNKTETIAQFNLTDMLLNEDTKNTIYQMVLWIDKGIVRI